MLCKFPKLAYYLQAVRASQWQSVAPKELDGRMGILQSKHRTTIVLQKPKPIEHCKTSWTRPLKSCEKESSQGNNAPEMSVCECTCMLLFLLRQCLFCVHVQPHYKDNSYESMAQSVHSYPDKGVYTLTCGPRWLPVIGLGAPLMPGSNQKEIWQWVILS